MIVPVIQYGTTKVNKKINNQNPAANTNKNNKKPKNVEISNMSVFFIDFDKNNIYFIQT